MRTRTRSKAQRRPHAKVAVRRRWPLVAAACLGVLPAHAQNATWTPGTSNWNTNTNWTPATAPTGIASFNAAGITSLTFSAPTTSVGELQFNGGAPAYTFNINGVTFNLTGVGVDNNSANAPTFIISGAGGALTFSNAATAENSNITVNSGGIVSFTDTSSGGTAALVINSGGTADFSGLTGGGTGVASISGAGDITLGSKELTVSGASSTAFSGVIAGVGGSLVKDGGGTLTLSGTNTYTGGTTIDGGALSVSADANLGAAAGTVTFGGGTLQYGASFNSARDLTVNAGGGTINTNGFNATLSGTIDGAGLLTKTGGGTLTLTGTNTYSGGTAINGGTVLATVNANLGNAAGGLSFNGGTLQYGGSFDMTRGITLNGGGGTFDTNGFTSNLGGAISGGGALTKTGAGILALDVVNTYTGATNINAGTLRTDAAGALSASTAVTVAGGAIFDLNGNNQSIGSLAGAGDVTLGAATLTTGNNNTSTAFSGVISGAGGLIKDGNGTFTLSGANAYLGGTEINGGTLAVSANANLGNAAGTLSFDGGTLQYNASFNSARDITVNAGGGTINTNGSNATLSGVIDGAGLLTKTDTGTLTLSGTNTWSGGTAINGGTLSVSADANLGNAAGNLSFNGGTLQYGASFDTARDIVLNAGGGTFDTNGFTSTLTGVISGGGALNKAGTGLLILDAANTYTGATNINAGTLRTDAANALTTSTAVTVASGAIFDLNGNNQSIGSLAGAGNVTLGAGTLTTGNTGASTSYSGVMSGTGGLIKVGAGTFTISGTNTYQGGTEINGGTLAVSADANLGDTAGNVSFNGGTLQYNASFNSARDVTLNAGGGTFNTNGFNSTLSGVVDGAGLLTKTGAGTLTLSGTNTYLGGTAINGGTLSVSADANLGNAAGNLSFNGGTLQYGASFDSARGITLNAGGGIFDTNGFNSTLSGVIDGGGLLTKNGAGTLILDAVNTYSGNTTVNAGILQLGAGATIGTGGLTVNGGTFDLNDNTQTITFLGGTGGIVDLGSGTLTIDTNTNTTFSGAIIGPGGLIVKEGTGTATFTGTNTYTGGTEINAGAISVGADVNLGSVAANLVFNGGTLQVTGTTFNGTGRTIVWGGGGGTFDIANAANTFTVTEDLNAGGSLTKIGAGTLVLTGTNAYTGGTFITGGTLQVASDANLGAASGDITINGATFQYGGSFTTARDFTLGASGGTFDTNGFTGQIDGVISGAALTKTGTGTLVLNAVNTYTGATNINAGTLRTDVASALTTSTAVTVAGGAIFDLNGNNQSIGSLAGAGNVTLGAATLTTGNTGASTSYSGVMSGTGALIKVGAGTFTLSGANTYQGGTEINGGTLAVSADANLGDAAGNVSFNGGTLQYNASFNSARDITLNAGGGTFNTNGFSSILSGTIDGAGLLTKTGAGTLALSGTNTWLGGAAINGGTLSVAADANLGNAAGNVSFNGGTLQYGASFATARDFTLNGGGGTFDTNGFTATINGDISGAGPLTKTGSGSMVLAAAASYTVATNINAGTLRTDVVNALTTSTAVTVAGGAAFDLNGNAQSIGSLAGAGDVTLGAATLTTGNNNTSTTFSGVISGGGGLTKAGAGVFTLSGVNTYTGLTTIATGTLRTGIANALTTSTDVSVALGATFDLNGFNQSIASLAGAGNVALGAGTLTTGNDNTSTLFSGVISGTGALTKVGAGTLTLTGVNTHQGGTNFNGGSILATVNANLGNAAGPLGFDGGTLQYGAAFDMARNITLNAGGGTFATGAFDSILSGTISGGGALTKTGAGTLALNANNTYTGATNINAGTLRTDLANALSAATAVTVAGGATFDLNNNSQIIGTLAGAGGVTLGTAGLTIAGSGSTTYSGAISGVGGSLLKSGAGTLTLSGTSSYTGGTTISGGRLNVDGTIVSAAQINSGGVLGGAGNVTNITVNSGGTIAPGTPGTFEVLRTQAAGLNNGNVVFNAGSTFQVKVDPVGNNDWLIVAGTAALAGGTVDLVVQGGNAYQSSTTYIILSATGGTIGQFAGATGNLAFLQPELTYDGTNVFLELTNGQFTSTNPNQNAVGGAIQNGFGTGQNTVGEALLNILGDVTSEDAPRVLNALSGEGTAATQETSFTAANMFTAGMTDQATYWMRGEGPGINGVTLGTDAPSAYAPEKKTPRIADVFAQFTPAEAPRERTWRTWFAGFGGSRKLNGDAFTAGFNHATGGAAAGLDYQINPMLLVGTSIGVSSSVFAVSERDTTGKLEGGHLGIYGAAKFGNVYAIASLAYAHYFNKTERLIPVGAAEKATAEFESDQFTGRFELGWRQSFGALALTPFGAIQFIDTWQQDYRETSVVLGTNAPGLYGLSFGKRAASSVPLTLGMQIDGRFDFANGWLWQPWGSVALVSELNPTRVFNASLLSLPNNPFVVSGAPGDDSVVKVQVGSRLTYDNWWSLFAKFEGDFSNRATAYSYMGGLSVTGWRDAAASTGAAVESVWSSSVNFETRYSSWSGNRGYPATASLERGSGWQIYTPLTYSITGAFTNDVRLELTARGGWVRSQQSTSDYVGFFEGQTDTVTSATLTYSGFTGIQPFFSLNLNLPTGSTKLFGAASRARMDSDFVDLATFGEGFNIGPTVGANIFLSESWTASVGAGYTHRGPYEREGSIDPVTKAQGVQVLTPGDVLTGNVSLAYQKDAWSITASGSYTYETPTYLDSAPSFRVGDRVFGSLFALYMWSNTSYTSLSASAYLAQKNKVLDPTAVILSVEALNSNSEIYRVSLGHTMIYDQWTINPSAGYMYRSENSFSPLTYQFVPPKAKVNVGSTVKYAITDTWSVDGRFEHFWSFEAASPDKLFFDTFIQGSGNPALQHTGWSASIGTTRSF